jgi:hypothetical protein
MPARMSNYSLNEMLMKAVEDHDVLLVEDYLVKGADPNYTRTWEGDATHQPTTPLRMVVFRISDNFLEEDDLKQFVEIAKLLVQYGAQSNPARQLAEIRYGKYNADAAPDAFHEVLRIIEESPV